jgi:ComEC/Rec2-related protein
MIRWLSKKISQVDLPMWLMLSLCLGISLAAGFDLCERKIFVIISCAILAGLVVFVLKKLYIVALVLVVVYAGILLSCGFRLLGPIGYFNGCGEFTLRDIHRSSGALELAVSSSFGNLVIKTAKELPYKISDRLLVCVNDGAVIKEQKMGKYYLAKYSTDWIAQTDEIEILSSAFSIKNYFNLAVERIDGIFNVLMPGDSGQLAKGLVFGDPDFSNSFSKKIKDSGLVHITAVSGYNISIILVELFNLLRNAIGKKRAFYLSILVLVAFCFMTGFPSSVVRAAIMGSTAIIAKMVGRKGSPINLLVLAALVMMVVNPFVIFDIGFQLSFLATVGIIYSQKISYFIKEGRWFSSTAAIFVESLMAQLFCFGVLLYHFGRISLIGLVSNIFILPIVPLAMSVVFIGLVIAVVNLKAAVAISTLFSLPVLYIKKVVEISSSFGSLNFQSIRFGLTGLISYYVIVLAVIVYLSMTYDKAQKVKF